MSKKLQSSKMHIAPTISLGRYKHTKSGKEYEVLGVALHTETNEYLVVYRPLYKVEYELFARPYGMFIENVQINGKTTPRFEKVDE